MLLLGIDFETTGLDTKTLDVIEVGAVLWDSVRKKPLMVMDEFVCGPTVPAEITELTGITQDDLLLGKPLADVRASLLKLVELSEVIVAHNGTNFDRPIFERLINHPIHWVDTSVDVPYPKQITTRKLTHLAAEHGFANPFPHRAVFDVMTMLRIMNLYDLSAILELSKQPAVTIRALVSFDEKEKAKARGYRWNTGDRTWTKTVRHSQVAAEVEQAGFRVEVQP